MTVCYHLFSVATCKMSSLDHFIDLLTLEDEQVMNITCKAKPLRTDFECWLLSSICRSIV